MLYSDALFVGSQDKGLHLDLGNENALWSRIIYCEM